MNNSNKLSIFAILSVLALLFPTTTFGFIADDGIPAPEFKPQQDRIAIPPPDDSQTIFKSYAEIPQLFMQVPTVVELELMTQWQGFTDQQPPRKELQAIYSQTTESFQPIQNVTTNYPLKFIITDDKSSESIGNINDGNTNTYVEYAPNVNENNSVTLTFSPARKPAPLSATALEFKLAENITPPSTVTIKELNSNTVLVNNRAITGIGPEIIIPIPTLSSSDFEVTFTFEQILRISEIRLNQTSSVETVRFLALPGEQYIAYFDADRLPRIITGERGNLTSETYPIEVDVNKLNILDNPLYEEADSDSDGIVDSLDNCIYVVNNNQQDLNNNDIGDACEDFDYDGIMNDRDNCPETPNRLQQDEDEDGIGDHCDDEESRLTEQFGWLPWLGILLGVVVVGALLKTTVSEHNKTTQKEEEQGNTDQPTKEDVTSA